MSQQLRQEALCNMLVFTSKLVKHARQANHLKQANFQRDAPTLLAAQERNTVSS